MKFCWDRLTAETDHRYTITLGGHDTWLPGHLELLTGRLDHEIPMMLNARPNPVEIALLYTDVMQVNHQREIVGRYMDVMQIGQIPRAMIPHFAIVGMNSPHFFGLFNERIRKQIKIRYPCAGFDHLVIAEAALHGQILFEGRSPLHMLGPDPDPRGLASYGEKHLPAEALKAGMRDYLQQIEWYRHMILNSLDYCPAEAKPLHQALGITSMIALYMALRGQNLLCVPGAMEQFNNDQNVKMVLGGAQHIEKYVNLLLADIHPEGENAV
jgi:hypothetical protein